MIQYLKKNKAAVNLEDTPLATPGGEGSVYKIINMPGYCAKIYHIGQLSKEKERKIEYLIKNHTHQQPNDKILICWPIDLVYNKSGNFVGFIMPLAFSNSIDLYEIVTLRIRSHLDSIWKKKFDRNTVDGIQNRLKICVNIAIALHSLHITKHYILVDFKPKNILITLDGKVSVTDIDSTQISNNGQVLHHAKVATPEYAPRESKKLNPANDLVPETWDRFSLAVVFYEILFGIHPYAATAGGQYDDTTTIDEKIRKNLFVHGSKKNYLTVIPLPHNNYNILPDTIKKLFINAFEMGSVRPILRPSAEEWGKVIVDELNKTSIKIPKAQPLNRRPDVKNVVFDQVKILSNPLGALVFHNSEELGTTPFFIDRKEYLNKTLKVAHGNRFTTIFIDDSKNEICAYFPVKNTPINPSPPVSPPVGIKVILFIIAAFLIAFSLFIISKIKNPTIASTTDSTAIVTDTNTLVDTVAVSTTAEDYYTKGKNLFEQAQYQQSVLEFTKAINTRANYTEAYNGRGDAYLYLGKNNNAINDYSTAIEISPNYAEAYNNRGHAKYNADDKEGGCKDWEISCNLGFQKACYDYQTLCR